VLNGTEYVVSIKDGVSYSQRSILKGLKFLMYITRNYSKMRIVIHHNNILKKEAAGAYKKQVQD
jgi:hypothetical protein